MEKSSELVLFESTNGDYMKTLRDTVNKNFGRIWLYLYNYGGENFKLTVCNCWSGKINEELGQKISDFVTEYVVNNPEPKETTDEVTQFLEGADIEPEEQN